MKLRIILIGALALFAGSALAQTATLSIRWALVPLDARTTFVSQHDTQAQCDAAARAANRTRVYTCERRLDAVAAVVVPPTCTTPRPADSQVLQCPTGSTGSWTQTRSVTAATYPTCWSTGAWTPAGAPAGACTPIVVPPPPPPPPTTGLTYVNPALIPPARGGSPTRDIRQTGEQPYRDPDGMGAFRTVCKASHYNFDDPLLYPGVRGASHLHVWFGNTLGDYASTSASLLTTGNSTCRGGTVARVAAWVPALVTTEGRPLVPSHMDYYQKTGYGLFGQNAAARPIPVGLRMIAGDSKSRVSQQRAYFECNGSRMAALGACSGELTQVVEFPQCWDNANLASPDHKSHVVYASGGSCPASHPVHFPEVSYHIRYFDVPAGVRLASDMTGAPAGATAHGDWWNAWDPEVNATWVREIINKGLSGGSHMVGDGRSLY